MIKMSKINLDNIIANKTLFYALLKLAAKPVKEHSQTKVRSENDDCNDKQTHSRKSEGT